MNTLGQIAGWSQTSDRAIHLVIWQHGDKTDLGDLGGCCVRAVGINPAGQIAGALKMTPEGPERAFLWEQGVVTRIGDWTEGFSSAATSINEAGQVVGIRTDVRGGPQHAFLWEQGRLTDLNAGFEESASYGINESGQVVGTARIKGGDSHATLWVLK